MTRRLKTFFICEAVAVLAWLLVPGTAIDRAFFRLTANSFSKSAHFVSGTGEEDKPFTLHTLRDSPPDVSGSLPADIVIGDDPEKVFQTSPPSPVDFAVILRNLRRMGRERVAIGMPLSWPEPDVISLTALDQQLDAFPGIVTSAPLSRNPVASPIPPAFRRASVPLFSVKGDSSLLPAVNHIPIPDVVLGNESSLAGFTQLESLETTDLPQLLARWDDRVVLSFHLLVALQHFKVPPHAIQIRLGEWISLGADGPFIPLDGFGRLAIRPPRHSLPGIPAENLVDAPDDFLTASPAVIRNGLSAAEPAAIRYSESLVPTVAMLTHPEGTSANRSFPRPPWYAELLLIASALCLIYGFRNYTRLSGKLPLAVLAGSLLILHFILVPAASTWIPTLPMLACTLTAIAFTFTSSPATPRPAPPAEKTIPEKKAAKKSPKKTAKKAAKKAAQKTARKAPAKKTPRNRKGA
ncbi:hypothetical protein HZ994_06125 [Akkermansiaceae bacterium]|nr:hypothetical protein HZ994_06125 [Akkermansiaceae bacterium]